MFHIAITPYCCRIIDIIIAIAWENKIKQLLLVRRLEWTDCQIGQIFARVFLRKSKVSPPKQARNSPCKRKTISAVKRADPHPYEQRLKGCWIECAMMHFDALIYTYKAEFLSVCLSVGLSVPLSFRNGKLDFANFFPAIIGSTWAGFEIDGTPQKNQIRRVFQCYLLRMRMAEKVGVIFDHFKFMILNLKKDFISRFTLTDHFLTIKTNWLQRRK